MFEFLIWAFGIGDNIVWGTAVEKIGSDQSTAAILE